MGALKQQFIKPTHRVNIFYYFACYLIFYILHQSHLQFSYVSNFSQAFKCHHIIFVGIRSQMSHKPMKTACWFADCGYFILRKEPGFFFFSLLNPLKSQSLSAAFWNLSTTDWVIVWNTSTVLFQRNRQKMLGLHIGQLLPGRDGWTWLYGKPLFSP